MKNTKGITLVALVVTIIVLLILAGITISQLANNGLFARAIQAEAEQKKAKYYEEINVEIYNEHMERATEDKNTAFISDFNEKIKVKDWVSLTIKCDGDFYEQNDDYKNTVLFIETKDGYEIIVDIDNNIPEAKIREDYFKKVADKCKVIYDANGGTGTMTSIQGIKGTSAKLTSNKFTKSGYEFLRWNTKADGTGTNYENGASITINENITLYAIWGPEVIYLYKDGIIGTEAGDFEAKTASTSSYTAGSFTKNSNNLFVSKNTSSSQWVSTGFLSKNAIDITGYDTLTFTYDTSSYIKQSKASYIDKNLYWDMGITASNATTGTAYSNSFINGAKIQVKAKEEGNSYVYLNAQYDVDISNYDGSYYIGGCATGAYWSSETHQIYVTSIYLH